MHETSLKAITSSVEQEQDKIKKLLADHAEGSSETIQKDREEYKALE